MDIPKIGFIWHISEARCKALGINFSFGMTICMSTCKKYFNGSRSGHNEADWQIGLPLTNGGNQVRVDKVFASPNAGWEQTRILMLNNGLGPPDESYIPPPPPPTLKEVRTKRFSLVLRDM